MISSSWLVYTRFDQKWSFLGVAIVCEVAPGVVNLIKWLLVVFSYWKLVYNQPSAHDVVDR